MAIRRVHPRVRGGGERGCGEEHKRLFWYAHCMRRGRRRHKRSSALATRNSQVRDREYRLDPAPRSSLCSTDTSHPPPSPHGASMHINVNASRVTPGYGSVHQNSVTRSILSLHFINGHVALI